MDNLTPEQRKKAMQALKSTGMKQEVRIAKALWHLGYRYRKNDKSVFGKPDLTFKKYKLAVFIDGEFFHGKDWNSGNLRVKTNSEYWFKKIQRNMQRDIEVNTHLKNNGWTVIRFWSKDVKKDLESCVKIIEHEINHGKSKPVYQH